MKRLSVALALAASLVALPAAQAQEAETLVFQGENWSPRANVARVEALDGREALYLERGRIWLDDAAFQDGVIEFELRMDQPVQGFAGVSFRAADFANFEDLYLRSHLSGQADAVQYMPVINGSGAWQIHAAGEGWAAAPFRHGEWMSVRLVVEGDRADLYVDGEEPVLHMPDLKADLGAGGLALRASGRQGFHFANFSRRPLRPGEGVVGSAEPLPALPEGLIANWSVSNPFPASALEADIDLPPGLIQGRSWAALGVETNGIANLSRAAVRSAETDTVFAAVAINSESATRRMLHFGYSDRVRVYLNGVLIFAGDAGWSTRDYRFLGTVVRQDAVALSLREGRNELVFAASETFGGWAVTADLPDRAGLTLVQP
jgi:hypothetical protein